MTILEQLADHARARVAVAKEKAGLDSLQAQCRSLERTLGHGQGRERFQKALSKPGLSFLCELKKASPSKGLIDPEFPYLDIAKDYEAAGADAISCLTEPNGSWAPTTSSGGCGRPCLCLCCARTLP